MKRKIDRREFYSSLESSGNLKSIDLGVEADCSIPSDDVDPNIQHVSDAVLCHACQSGESYDDDEILFCDKCNVPVHQSCYGIDKIPAGYWYCDPCRVDSDPSTLRCELCENVGGAYKPVSKGQKWVHSLCFLCIPEVYAIPKGESYVIGIDTLDPKRSKLRCQLCKKIGCCIQCSYRRCAAAVHPWCVFHNPKGFEYIRNEHQEVHAFCPQHISFKEEAMKLSETATETCDSVAQLPLPKTKPKFVRSSKKIAASELIGRVILRDFGKHGLFMGYIRSYSQPYFLVEYPIDGDAEEMTIGEILPLLLSTEK